MVVLRERRFPPPRLDFGLVVKLLVPGILGVPLTVGRTDGGEAVLDRSDPLPYRWPGLPNELPEPNRAVLVTPVTVLPEVVR